MSKKNQSLEADAAEQTGFIQYYCSGEGNPQ
jgi:hypothetical protein